MSTDQVLQLQEPFTDGGIRAVNFFNGRLLTGKDLSREQEARRAADARLGLALGDGVAFGLEAARDRDLDAPAAPVLRVKAGLAVNRAGQTLRLTRDTSVALTSKFSANGSTSNSVFASCNPIAGGAYVAGAGVYILTIAPAQGREGQAPTNGLDPVQVRCSSDATVEAVQFRLLAINPQRFADLDLASPLFRNRLAYRCFGIEAREPSANDPWREDPPSYGLVDELRDTVLSDCDVPLALMYWTASGIQFVDGWAVRRALLPPDALAALSFVRRGRRLVEAHAMCAQFQQQLADLLAVTADPSAVIARDHFRYLPPFGIVPLQTLPLRGFREENFFSGLTRRPVAGSGQGTEFFDVRQLGRLRAQALAHTPTDVAEDEFIWVYRPWQNVKAVLEGHPVQPVLVFASGQVPDVAVARFDMARFDFSNYENCCGS